MKKVVVAFVVFFTFIVLGCYIWLSISAGTPFSEFLYNKVSPEAKEAKEEAQTIVDEIITTDMSEFEKAMAIHDWLTFQVDYNYSAFLENEIPYEDHTALGVFENRRGVCDGYSEAFSLMCESAGLEVAEVSGSAKGLPHRWNQVRIDGIWYNVDVTFDDPTTDVNKNIQDNSNVCYAYFLISDELMEQDHIVESEKNTCTETYDRKSIMEFAVKSGLHGNNMIVADTLDECVYKISKTQGANNINIWYYDPALQTENDGQLVAYQIIKGSPYLSRHNIRYSYSCANGFLKMAVTIE